MQQCRRMRRLRGTGSMVVLPLVVLALLVSLSAVVSAQETSDTAPPAGQSQEADDPCDRRSFSTLFRCIPHDLGNVVRGESLAWLGAAGGMAAGSAPLDDDVDRALRDGDPNLFPGVGDQLGQVGVHFGGPLALYVVARTTGHSETAAFAVTLLRAQIANGIVTRALKLIPRPRPSQEEARLASGSFPSGHTSSSFATATVIHPPVGVEGRAAGVRAGELCGRHAFAQQPLPQRRDFRRGAGHCDRPCRQPAEPACGNLTDRRTRPGRRGHRHQPHRPRRALISEAIGIQNFRRQLFVERREAVELRVVQPVVRVDHVQVVARRENPPEA